MHHRLRLLACSTLVAGVSLAIALPSGVASAHKVKPDKGTCTSLSGNATSQTMTGCTDSIDTGGSGVSTTTHEAISGSTVSGTDSVAWHSGLTSTESFTGTLKSGKADKCSAPAGDTNLYEVKEKGSVTGGTATHLVGSKTKGTVCTFTAPSGVVVKNFPGKLVAF